MTDLRDRDSNLGGPTAPATPKRRTVASVFSALVGIIWAGFSAFCFLGALLQGPPAARIIAALLFIAGAMLALPWTVAWLRGKGAFLRPTFVPPLGAMLATVAGLIVITSSIPEEERRAWAVERERLDAERDAAREADQIAAQQRSEAEASGQDGAREASEERREARQREEVAGQINAMWRDMTSVTRPCDQAAETASSALGRSDLVGSYQAAQNAQRICASAALDVRRLDAPPSLDRAERRGFEEAIEACSDAYAGKAVMFNRMLTVIDGDMRPSRVAAVQEASRISQAQVIQCVLRLHTLASEQGVELGGSEAPD